MAAEPFPFLGTKCWVRGMGGVCAGLWGCRGVLLLLLLLVTSSQSWVSGLRMCLSVLSVPGGRSIYMLCAGLAGNCLASLRPCLSLPVESVAHSISLHITLYLVRASGEPSLLRQGDPTPCTIAHLRRAAAPWGRAARRAHAAGADVPLEREPLLQVRPLA